MSAVTVSGTDGCVAIDAPFRGASTFRVQRFTSQGLVSQRFEAPREGNGYAPMLREVTVGIQRGEREHQLHTLDQTVRTYDILDEIRRQIS